MFEARREIEAGRSRESSNPSGRKKGLERETSLELSVEYSSCSRPAQAFPPDPALSGDWDSNPLTAHLGRGKRILPLAADGRRTLGGCSETVHLEPIILAIEIKADPKMVA